MDSTGGSSGVYQRSPLRAHFTATDNTRGKVLIGYSHTIDVRLSKLFILRAIYRKIYRGLSHSLFIKKLYLNYGTLI